MDYLEQLDLASKVLAGLTVTASTVYSIWRWIVRPTRQRTQRLLDFIKELQDTARIVKNIEPEFKNNGGNSLRDKIERAERTAHLSLQMQQIMLSDSQQGVFRSDEHGRCVWVNATYRRMVKRDMSDILGNGWITSIAAEFRDSVQEEWTHAVEQSREFNMTYDMVDSNGKRIPVNCRAQPLCDQDGKVWSYVGRVYYL